MRVVITHNAEENLLGIYAYHAEYSIEYADTFQDEIISFLMETLRDNPKFGRPYNEAAELRRLVYKKRHNVYYLIRDEVIYILYIIGGRMLLNTLLEEPDVELPIY